MSDTKQSELDVCGIVEKYLKDNGYDGLAGEECGCFIGSLFPCECVNMECVPGHEAEMEYDGKVIIGIAPGRKK